MSAGVTDASTLFDCAAFSFLTAGCNERLRPLLRGYKVENRPRDELIIRGKVAERITRNVINVTHHGQSQPPLFQGQDPFIV